MYLLKFTLLPWYLLSIGNLQIYCAVANEIIVTTAEIYEVIAKLVRYRALIQYKEAI